MNTTEALVLFADNSPDVLPAAVQVISDWTAFCRNALPEDPIPVNALGQSVADDIRLAVSKAGAFMAEYEKAAKQAREPFYERFKAMKARSDVVIMEFAAALGELTSTLRDFEAEKRRVEERINAQREADARKAREEEARKQREAEEQRRRAEQAEIERLAAIARAAQAEQDAKRRAELEAKAVEERKRQEEAAALREQERMAEQQRLTALQPEKFESAKTEGATVKTPFTYEVTDPYLFFAWCAQNRPGWLNQAKLFDVFSKREIQAALNQPEADHDIPGLRVFRELALNVRKARTPRAITVQSSRVEL